MATTKSHPPKSRQGDSDLALPPRPYSCYSIFFRIERARILQFDGIIDEEVIQSLDPNHVDPLEFPRPPRYEGLIMQPYWYSSAHRSVVERKRKHRKKAGRRLSMETMSKLIAETWGQLRGSDVYLYCNRLANAEVEKHTEKHMDHVPRRASAALGESEKRGEEIPRAVGRQGSAERASPSPSLGRSVEAMATRESVVKGGYGSMPPNAEVGHEPLNFVGGTLISPAGAAGHQNEMFLKKFREYVGLLNGGYCVDGQVQGATRYFTGGPTNESIFPAQGATPHFSNVPLLQQAAKPVSPPAPHNGSLSQQDATSISTAESEPNRIVHMPIRRRFLRDFRDMKTQPAAYKANVGGVSVKGGTPRSFNGRSLQQDVPFEAQGQDKHTNKSILPGGGYILSRPGKDEKMQRAADEAIAGVHGISQGVTPRFFNGPSLQQEVPFAAQGEDKHTNESFLPEGGHSLTVEGPPATSPMAHCLLSDTTQAARCIIDLEAQPEKPCPDARHSPKATCDSESMALAQSSASTMHNLLNKLNDRCVLLRNDHKDITPDVVPSAATSSDVVVHEKPSGSSIDTPGQQELPESDHPICLFIPTDSKVLDPVNNFARCHCIELFAKRPGDSAPGRVGQVGLRCFYCKNVCFPSGREVLFENVLHFQRGHLEDCQSFPDKMKEKYWGLIRMEYWSERQRPSRAFLRAYYAEAAGELGLVDSPQGGLVFGAPQNKSGVPSKRLRALLESAGFN